MQNVLPPLLLVVSLSLLTALDAQGQELTAASLPEFLASYEKSLTPIDSTYADLANENLILRDEKGNPLKREHFENRRQGLAELRQTTHELAASPSDLVSTITTFIETESLADELFDLSQTAYDNDREELGKRLADLHGSIERDKHQIQFYLLSLASEKQGRIRQLERENAELQQKLKDATQPRKGKSGRR